MQPESLVSLRLLMEVPDEPTSVFGNKTVGFKS